MLQFSVLCNKILEDLDFQIRLHTSNTSDGRFVLV